MQKKRIAMISYHSCPLSSKEGKTTGGLEIYVLELSKALAKKGIAVDMFTRSQDENDPLIEEVAPNLRLFHLPAGPKKRIEKKQLLQYIPEYIDVFTSFVEERKLEYDVLHCHYYMSGLIGLEINKRREKKLPLVMYFHTLALMKNLVARDELEKEEIERIQAEYTIVKEATRIITPTDSEMSYLEYLYQADKNKITIIPPGVDTSFFKPMDQAIAKQKIGAKPTEKILLFVGRIEPLKGLDMLMYALKVLIMQNPDLYVSLWIVGGDISQPQELWSHQLQMLQQLKEVLHLSTRVKFVGMKRQEELPDYYNAAEMVIMPSHYESFGMVTLEAMACGTPVITTNVAGVSQLIDKKHGALITSVNNPLLLASQIKYLLTDEAAHTQISAELREKASGLSWDVIVNKNIKVYESL
jgi:D-inositol-3-phosphate glycosyltransferase